MGRLAGTAGWSDFQGSTGETVDWAQESCSVAGSGAHTLTWRYVKNGWTSSYYDCGWVDYVQWSGVLDNPLPTDWTTVGYTYDPAGRRIAKSYDGTVVARYLYDGPHIIAEYDGNSRLLRKYVHGPAVDQPICMIDANETSYYHYDGLGSVVALSDAAGEAAVLYEYSIYGQVASSDPNHPNPFLFTGREFDKETGLYYYRARYYNPYIGRFLQTDPLEYGVGPNLYLYCRNNPLIWMDPTGLEPVLKRDNPGSINDLWERITVVSGDYPYKDNPYNHPEVLVGTCHPYYMQNDAMACVPTAILNWWLTYDVGLPVEVTYDYEAEDYVESLIDRGISHDWNREGVSNLEIVRSIIDPAGVNTIISRRLTAESIATYVMQGRAVITAYNISANNTPAWHAVVIVPVNKGYLKKHPEWDILVLNPTAESPNLPNTDVIGGGCPAWFSKDEFIAWWNSQDTVSVGLVAKEDYRVSGH